MSTCTYSGGDDGKLDLAPGGAHKDGELLGDAFEDAESVVLGKSVEEVLDRVGLVLDANLLLKLGDNLGLVRDAESRGGEDLLELGVALEDGGEALEGLGGVVQRLGLDGGSVL